jgi:hypothetical protein
VVGFLSSRSPGEAATVVAAFHQGLAETGYVQGQNLAIEYRWAEGRYDRLPVLAAELVGLKVDMIVATGGTPSALAAKNATSKIPIVFVSSDPVKYGLVASLSRPGGNLTGFSLLGDELLPKRLELLAELVPQARVIALLVNPNNTDTERSVGDVQEAARVKGVQLHILTAGTASEIDAAFAFSIKFSRGTALNHNDSTLVRALPHRGEPVIEFFGKVVTHLTLPSGERAFVALPGHRDIGAARGECPRTRLGGTHAPAYHTSSRVPARPQGSPATTRAAAACL